MWATIAIIRWHFIILSSRTKAFRFPNWYEKRNVRINSFTVFKWNQGRYKTHQRLLQSYWWPSMFKDICLCIDQCKICVMTKTDNRPKSNLDKRPFCDKAKRGFNRFYSRFRKISYRQHSYFDNGWQFFKVF